VKFFFLIFALLAFMQLNYSFAQDQGSLDFDIDSLFDAPPAVPPGTPPAAPETTPEVTPPAGETSNSPDQSSKPQKDNSTSQPPNLSPDQSGESMMNMVKPRGFSFDASFQFLAGLAPGWNETPWNKDENSVFNWGQSAKMRADFGLDAQISDVFRTRTVVYFEIPNFALSFGDFFFDYNIYNRVFVRAGKYALSWGISPNYSFTNLLTRVPIGGDAGDSYLFKADIPIGIGGVQLLVQTRADLMNGEIPGWRSIGYGGKYNLALQWVDFDLGAFYQDNMPFRGFFSIKMTIGKTEVYSEYLGANLDKPDQFSGACNIGFFRDFFDGKFSVNGEFFYNAEKESYWYRPETTYRNAEVVPFQEGLNAALNLVYRFDAKANPRLFVQTLYNLQEDSAQLVPGLRLNILPFSELYIAVPMALGSKEGYYYYNTPDLNNRPFSIIFLISLKGGIKTGFKD